MSILSGLMFLLCCLTDAAAWAQTSSRYAYYHYNTTNGLTGDVVYDIVEDSYGRIWIATSSGVSRIDAFQIKNFNAKDGLSGMDVYNLFVDKQNRVWFNVFIKALCFYQNGKIYNASNCTLINHLSINSVQKCLLSKNDSVSIQCDK